ncbi:unnamed protein product [Lymnaea stagnalis]|uniref:Uncharacterized protein n=1 Tax=Lymnaea stagnalis TaxID=6523 RepID=A0AAV2HET0_LYMST
MLRGCLLLAGLVQAALGQNANLAGYGPQYSAGGPGIGNSYLSSVNAYPGGLGSAYPGGLNYGQGNLLYGGSGYGGGILSPVGRYGLTGGANSYNSYPQGKYSDNLKLTGSALFVEKQGYNSGSGNHGLAVTVAKNAPSLLFGDYFGGQGLSMNLQVQTPLAGYYHVVVTSFARIQDGCSADTLGNILTNPSVYYPVYGGAKFGDAGLPEGAVAFVELGSNVQKSLYVGRIPQFDKLEDIAGRGVAICAADGPDSSKTPCRGQIVACVGLAYSKDDASLPSYEPQSYKDKATPQQPYDAPKTPQIPYDPPKTPQQPYAPPKTPQQPYDVPKTPQISYDAPKTPQQQYDPPKTSQQPYEPSKRPQGPYSPSQTGGNYKNPEDDYYSGQPYPGTRYYDGNSEGEYDKNSNQLVDTYNPPRTPTGYEYEANLSRRPKAKEGPIWYGPN